ncbi:NAD-dependent malic enzyme [Sphingomonas sp. LB3N6]|uniref:NAD-dependent malic enzyme n=1 Tax=Sphingomonas fucosidasi TaxID=3096164 RepID=UPI002FCBF518
MTNKGTAFTEAERDRLGLHGLLPPHVATLETQIERRRRALDALPDDFHRYAFLRELQDTNEVLFQALVQSDLPRMLPLVYTPTVGEGCRRFSEIWRRPRGLFLSWPYRERIADILADPALDRIKVIVVSDGERILGLGDQGAGGMGIPIGKLALYTACAGFHPAEVLPILLDVGTDNPALHSDPLYVGWRHSRVRGADYDDFVERFIEAVVARWPGVLLQWEDFAGTNAYCLLDRYRDRLPSFNDDIQGTAATALGALLAAVGRTGSRLGEQRIVLVGAGAAGTGIAELVIQAMVADGVAAPDARQAIWAVDRAGLVIASQAGLTDAQTALARDASETLDWTRDASGVIPLVEVVRRVHPTVMIGTTGRPGTFREDAVREMAAGTARPIILPLSNPATHAEAHPSSLLEWTDGQAIVGTGSPFGVPGVSQVNNVHIFPGIGLGVVASGARYVSDGMFLAAARTLAGEAARADALLPPITSLRATACAVARAVIASAQSEGLAVREPSPAETLWEATY